MASVTDFRRTARDVSNWGRWGDDDELGTLNFITEEKIAQAASLVRHGRVFPLGVDFGSSGPQGAFGFRHNPIHVMTVDGGDASTLAQYGPDWDRNPTAAQMGRSIVRDGGLAISSSAYGSASAPPSVRALLLFCRALGISPAKLPPGRDRSAHA